MRKATNDQYCVAMVNTRNRVRMYLGDVPIDRSAEGLAMARAAILEQDNPRDWTPLLTPWGAGYPDGDLKGGDLVDASILIETRSLDMRTECVEEWSTGHTANGYIVRYQVIGDGALIEECIDIEAARTAMRQYVDGRLAAMNARARRHFAIALIDNVNNVSMRIEHPAIAAQTIRIDGAVYRAQERASDAKKEVA